MSETPLEHQTWTDFATGDDLLTRFSKAMTFRKVRRRHALFEDTTKVDVEGSLSDQLNIFADSAWSRCYSRHASVVRRSPEAIALSPFELESVVILATNAKRRVIASNHPPGDLQLSRFPSVPTEGTIGTSALRHATVWLAQQQNGRQRHALVADLVLPRQPLATLLQVDIVQPGKRRGRGEDSG